MKLRVLSLMVPALLVAGTAGAAEIYNKDGNKLDLYGKVDGLHYFSSNPAMMARTAISLICVLACVAKRKSAIS